MALTDIKQLLPRDAYNAIIGANSPSASNVFATMLDLAGLGSGIYSGSGALQAGDTTVTMDVTDKLLFNSLNGPYDLFTIDAVNNRIGIGIASPGHTFHMVAGNMFIQDGVAAIGTTTPSAGQMLKISAGDSQISSSLLQGVRIDLSPLASAGGLNAWGVDVRHDDARSGTGTKQFFMFDANYTGSSASAGTHTNYGIRSRATMTVGGTANVTNIGGYFEAANGTNNYAIQIVDGSQGLNKVLRSDANGVGSWVDINTLVTPATTLYNGDGTVGAGRVATLTDTFAFNDGSNNVFKIFANGNVGIGNTVAQSQLQVAGMIRAMSTTPPALTTGKSVEFYFNAGSDQGRILAYDRDTAQYKDMVIGNGATPNKFTIFASGNVGIGTEVDGGAKLSVRAFSTGTDKAFVVKNNTESLDLFRIEGNGIGYLRNQLILESALAGTDTLVLGTQSINRRAGILFNNFNGANSSAIYDRADGTYNNGLTLKSRNNIFQFLDSANGTANATIFIDKLQNVNSISARNVQPLLIQGSLAPNDINDGVIIQTHNGSAVNVNRLLIQTQADNVNAFLYNINGFSVGTITPPTSMLTVNGDIETLGNTNGLVVLDRTDGNRYRIYTDNGVLNTELA